MSPHFLAFDVGTSGVKVVVVGADGHLVDSSYRAYGLLMVADAGVEQDLGLIVASTLEAARELVDRQRSTVSIAGISVTAQMFNVVPVDERGRPLGPMLSWLEFPLISGELAG